MRQRFKYDLIRLRWLVERLGTPVAAGPASASIPGAETEDMLKPRPTSWAVLEVGDNADVAGLDPGALRSAVQYLTR